MVKPSNPEGPRTISVALLLIVLLNDMHSQHTSTKNILKQKYKYNGHDYKSQVFQSQPHGSIFSRCLLLSHMTTCRQQHLWVPHVCEAEQRDALVTLLSAAAYQDDP